MFSGYTLGRFQGDAAAGNPRARDAFYDIMGQALADGKMRPERYEEIMSGLGYIATKQNPISRHKDFLNQILQSPEGKQRIAEMDEAILQDDEQKVGRLEQAFEDRWGQAVDPISLAMLAVWANKFGDLNQTTQILTGKMPGKGGASMATSPRTGEVLDYLAGQKFFQGEDGKRRYRVHLEGLANGVSQSLQSGALSSLQLLPRDVQELNRRLQAAESQVRLRVKGLRSTGIHNDRDGNGLPDDLQTENPGFVSPLIRRRADAGGPTLTELAAMEDDAFAKATRGTEWRRFWTRGAA